MTLTVPATLLVLVGVFAVVVAARQRSARRVSDLSAVLDTAFLDARPLEGESGAELRAFLARSGRAAERALGRTGVFQRVRENLDRSDWTLSPGEFLAFTGGAGAAGLLLGLLAASPVLAGLLLLAGLVLPVLLVTRSVSRRRARFEEQFPDVLDLVAASLESGGSIGQALELVVAEADEPSASEFARVLSATRLGSDLVTALRVMAERLDSRDLRYAVQAVAVQQRTGGRLAQVLRVVGDFMRGRAEVRREVSALTAEGRLSAYVLGGLPFLLAAVISLVNPGYLTPLFTSVGGLVLVSGATVLMVVAGCVMARIVKIEV